jgi:hypothetical protein
MRTECVTILFNMGIGIFICVFTMNLSVCMCLSGYQGHELASIVKARNLFIYLFYLIEGTVTATRREKEDKIGESQPFRE